VRSAVQSRFDTVFDFGNRPSLRFASAAAFGAFYPFISGYLGLFGGFLSGSEASTVAVFTRYHVLTSKILQVDALIVSAMTAIGGGLASVISPAKPYDN